MAKPKRRWTKAPARYLETLITAEELRINREEFGNYHSPLGARLQGPVSRVDTRRRLADLHSSGECRFGR